MSKKVLITGATGFVGYHLIAQALQAGLEVVAAVRPGTSRAHLKAFDISYVELNYASVADLRDTLEKYQFHYIIHAAGITKAKTREQYERVNAEFTRNLATAATEAKIPLEKFVFVSSLAALGPLADLSACISDEMTGQPVTQYGASKLKAEQYLSELPELPLIVIRPTAVYGPREKDIFILFKSIKQGIEPYIGSFQQQLSFIYVTDLAEIIIKSLFAEVRGRTYNISDGQFYDRYTLGRLIRKSLGKRTLRFHLPVSIVGALARIMDFLYRNRKDTPALNKEKMAELTAVNWYCDISRAKADLNFQPRYNLEKGIAETVAWYRENHWL
ncbi:NAD-dependent epimerase/dehydratase family protein [Pedobacter faecalis]|uniref:NAD-dependent epimerase/dehydratase family protein n=1 Tax=Pedobacter faecalis TaxID=3041495 RepID=UPI00255031E8|nr:NAD(P)-dependent oxidoreductase [Pedobacter sp. ELA7]